MIRVVLVDDVRELRVLVRMVLEDDDEIEVVGEAGDGREGVDVAAREQPDVVLLDLSMPDMDGLEAIPLIREQAPDARIVVLSGHEAGRVSLEALDQGATRYVNKAAEIDDMRSAVRAAARLDDPFTDTRFSIVRRMWTEYLNGRLDEALAQAHPNAVWKPCSSAPELRSPDEVRSFVDRLLEDGRPPDPRAYAVEPRGPGLIVEGTLEFRSPDGLTETPVWWIFCFREDRVALAEGFDRRDEAVQAIEERCAA